MSPPTGAAGADDRHPWGYLRPDCRGAKALVLFLDDLHCVLERYSRQPHSQDALDDAQCTVDALLANYRRVARAPHIFDGQSVTLCHASDEHGTEHVVPVFSPHLKSLLVDLLERSTSAHATRRDD